MNKRDFRSAPRRLLVGFDGSDGAEDAVELCRAIAPEGAHVEVVDVLPSPSAPSTAFRLLSAAEFDAPADYFAPATTRLAGREVETFTYLGASPARIFESLVGEDDLDMIVVGSPRHGTIGRIFSGSTAPALLHGAPVPVATAPHGYASRSHDSLGTIAVAYEGSEESKAALAYAQALARANDARLEVLTVERPVDPVRGAIAYTMSLPEDVEDIQRQARAEVDPSLDLRCRILHGDTAGAIAEACEKDVDLLVVGSRGYGTVERVLLGSTSTALVSKASCPVVVVPRPSEKASASAAVEGARSALGSR